MQTPQPESPETSAAEAIDVHGHLIPRELLDELVRSGRFGVHASEQHGAYLVEMPGAEQMRRIAGVMLDGEQRTAWLSSNRINHQVVAPWLDIQGQQLEIAAGRGWTRWLNDAMASAVANSRGLLSAHATVYLGDPAAAAEELRRAKTELKLRGLMVPCTSPRIRLSDPRLDVLWAAATELSVPIILHATTGSPAADLLSHYPSLRGLFARNIETTLVTAELLATGVLDRFPGLRLVNVHGGGLLPYQVGRFEQDHPRTAGPSITELVRTMYYDTVLLTESAIRFLLEFAGPDRIMLGSDFGATPTERPGVSIIEPIIGAADGSARAAVLGGNARRLFQLGADEDPYWPKGPTNSAT